MTCKRVRPAGTEQGKQGLSYSVGISAKTVGAKAIHLQITTIPPGGRAKAHKHEGHESAIYGLRGRSGCWYGERLEHHAWIEAGDYFYIPADVPHLPYNPSGDEPCLCIVARTDADDQESVTPLPDLDALIPDRPPT
ncbi:cupin domain-containing protein [Aureimonas leprariae]|uniref:Cupin domain-containing protein n=1 Tax=Plantimonas leprariae TaxID=2615207 RepID=A0A7V7TVG6_9HYPH|nr:cupin domain-containing protein [Aureimonas leprariae]KAB0677539.1 cupin domain-containing protein [Aureimonas leprariae]